jgi:hypothetical protein
MIFYHMSVAVDDLMFFLCHGVTPSYCASW